VKEKHIRVRIEQCLFLASNKVEVIYVDGPADPRFSA
jgi:hypothetical protein